MPSINDMYAGLNSFKDYINSILPFKQTVFSGTADPTTTGYAAPIGSMYVKVDNSGSVLGAYIKAGTANNAWSTFILNTGGMPVVLITYAIAIATPAITNLVDNTVYLLDFSGGVFNVTVPQSPATTLNVVIQLVGGDVYALAPTSRPQLLRGANAHNIMALAQDMYFDTNYARINLNYSPVLNVGFVITGSA